MIENLLLTCASGVVKVTRFASLAILSSKVTLALAIARVLVADVVY